MVLRRAAVLALVGALSGCVLFVDTFDTTDHCGIQGNGACATCLRNSCQTPIDRCCNQNECLGSRMLGTLDACGRGETDSCADVLNTTRLQKEEEELRSCAKSSCGQLCTQGSTGTGGDNRPKWTCATSREMNINCSACIYQKCATSIEACCSDSSCQNDSTIQTDMAACVAGDAFGCAFLLDDDRSTSGQAGVLRRCINEQCGSSCMNADKLPHTSCTLLSGGDYCVCSNAEVAGKQTCNEQTIGSNADCVLGTEGCTCGQYACSDDTVGCSCSFRGGVVGTSCTAASGDVCCLKRTETGVSCECKYSSCSSSDEVQIDSCSRADVIDAVSSILVTTCSR